MVRNWGLLPRTLTSNKRAFHANPCLCEVFSDVWTAVETRLGGLTLKRPRNDLETFVSLQTTEEVQRIARLARLANVRSPQSSHNLDLAIVAHCLNVEAAEGAGLVSGLERFFQPVDEHDRKLVLDRRLLRQPRRATGRTAVSKIPPLGLFVRPLASASMVWLPRRPPLHPHSLLVSVVPPSLASSQRRKAGMT